MSKQQTIFHKAPNQSAVRNACSIQGVDLLLDEEVDWSWTHTLDGSYVSGFNIRKAGEFKLIKLPEEISKALKKMKEKE